MLNKCSENINNRTFCKLHFTKLTNNTIFKVQKDMRTFYKFFITTCFTLLSALSNSAWGQRYVGTTWYSLYDETEYTASTTDVSGATLHSYPAYAPNVGTFSFDSKLPGDASSKSDWSASDSDPKSYDYGVTNYQLNVGNVNGVNVAQYVSVTTGSRESRKNPAWIFQTQYRYPYTYTYNYRTVNGSGLNSELTTITAKYVYTLGNAWFRTVYIKNVKVPMATHIRLKSQSNTNGVEEQTFNAFADTYWGTTCGTHQTIRLRSFLTTTGDNKITFTSSNPTVFRVGSADNTSTKVYEVGTNAFACESYSSVSNALNAQSYSCDVYFCPPDVGDYSADITISNGSNSAVVHVSGKGVKRNVNITTQPTVKAIEYLSLLETSTISNDGVAKDASDASTTVAGAFTWKTPTQQIQAAAGTQAYTMVFTPNDKTHYNVKEFNRDLTVQLKTSTITMSDEGHVKVHVAGLNDSSNEWKIDLDDLIASKMEDALDASRAGAVTYEVTSANKAKSSIGTENIFSATECGTYTIVAAQAATSYYAKATDEFVVTVDRLTPTITSTNRTIKVDSIVANAFSFTDAKDIIVHIDVKSISDVYKGAREVISYDYATNKITALNAGVAEIYLEQASTDYIEGGASEPYTVTVEKYSNTLSNEYTWSGVSTTNWNKAMGFDLGVYLAFTTTNNNPGAPELSVTQTAGDDYATYYPKSQTSDPNGDYVWTSYSKGKATWEIYQPEDYKYAQSNTRTLTIDVKAGVGNCYLKEWCDDEDHKQTASGIGKLEFKEGGVEIGKFADKVTFDIKCNGTSSGNQLEYCIHKKDGTTTSWTKKTAESLDYYTHVSEISLNGEAVAIEFKKSGTITSWDDPYVNNIRLTRKVWMNLKSTADANTTISSLAKLERKVGTAAKTATFYVDFSTCSDEVTVTSNHGNVTFPGGSVISTNHDGVVPVTISYSSDTIESKNVTITVFTHDNTATLTVPVQTTGIETELVYIGEVSYPVNSDNIAATSLFEVREKGTTTVVTGAAITIAKSGVSDAANVVENALEPLCGNKTINLTASFAGDNRHEPSSLATPQAITIDKIADAVSFNSHPVVVIGKSYDISAWASAHTALTFESGDDDIFSIDGTTLRAHKVGTTTLKATAAGNECTYLSGAFNTESITVQPGYIFNGNNDNQWEDESNWENGEKPTIDDDVIIRGNLVIDEVIEVKSLTIENTGNVTLTVNGSLTVGSGNSIEDLPGGYGNLHVENGGNVALSTGKLIVNDFILDAKLGDVLLGSGNAGVSGQVLNANKLDVRGNAYFDLALDPSGECSPGWYDFTVPFPVDALTGVSRFDNSTHAEKTIKNEVNYAIMDFSESRRVSTGYGWKKYRGIMQPGQCYTITIDDVDNVYRFKKTATGAFNTSMSESLAYTDVENANRGWNCLGNGTLAYANISAEGVERVQVYSHTTNAYTVVDFDDYTYIVGSAFMIQTPASNKAIAFTHEGATNTLRAPRRASKETEFVLSLSREDANRTEDRLFVGADEAATYSYEIGRELAKFGTPTDSKVAQVWVDAYGMKLCDIEMPLMGDNAECAISFYAPKAGTYTFNINRAPADATLYLTYNGVDVWNLSESAYTIDLQKGTTTGYGLRFNANPAPQITTGVENATVDGKSVRKVLINNTIYIVTPEGEMYDLMGKSVK